MLLWMLSCLTLVICLMSVPVTTVTRGDGLEDAWKIPVNYRAGRFFARPVATTGDTLTLFLDTGGGTWLFDSTVARLGMPIDSAPHDSTDGSNPGPLVAFPTFHHDASIPPTANGHIAVLAFNPALATLAHGWSGMLGAAWFGDRRWTLDYRTGELWFHDHAVALPPDQRRTVALGFAHDASGRRSTNLPRLRVMIDGDSIDMLFDTGASTVLSDAALKQLGESAPRERATSFIVASQFARWHERHPDWPVIEHAEQRTGAAMIQVPQVHIAGQVVGPVWFTVRPDSTFHRVLDHLMDQPVFGAIGGSGLHTCRVTLDYPEQRAMLDCE